MLQFIVGTAGTGKTTRLIEEISRTILSGRKAIFLVPEQFSFEGERLVYRRLGPQNALQVEVLSFTRLCHNIFRAYGGLAGTVITPTARYLLMSVVVEELRDTLEYYRKSAGNTAFLQTMVAACSELKTAGITPARLEGFVAECDIYPLKDKVRELSAIYSTYQGLLSRGYADPEDDLIRACEALENNDYFKDYAVFIDGFTTFMAAEFELLGHIIRQSPVVCACMTADAVKDRQQGMGIFSPVQAAIRRMMKMADNASVSIEEPIFMQSGYRYRAPELHHLSTEFLKPDARVWELEAEKLSLYPSADLYQEIEWVSVNISNLVMERGYRYRDIAVIARDTQPYQNVVRMLFDRYQIPYFSDEREDIENQPLISGILAAIDAVRSNFDTGAMLLLAKSPIIGLSAEQASWLENYCFCWGVRGEVWFGKFANNPRGLADTLTEEDTVLLQEINQIRLRLVPPLYNLKAAIRKGNGQAFAKGIYQYLLEIQATEHLTEYGKTLKQGVQESFLGECAQLWDTLMDILDVFGSVLGALSLSRKRLCELFRMAVGAAEVAEVPQTLDQVIVGQADRIRPGEVKAVFVIGANEGVFPRQISAGGLFSDAERQQLIMEGLEIAAASLQQGILEKFYAYYAVTLPQEKLYLSWPKSDLQGRELLPSIVVSGIKSLFSSLEYSGSGEPIERICGKKSAFALLARHYLDNTPLSATLLASFAEGEKLDSLSRMHAAAYKQPHRMADMQTAHKLFGQRMHLSPSRVERYYRCPFSYFAADGLGLRKRRKVEFTPLESGSVIHNVLQVMVQRYGGKGLAALEPEQLQGEIRTIIEAYLEQRVENMEVLPARFQYLFGRLVGMLSRLLRRIGEEFSQSSFEPAAFELPINAKGGVEPLQLKTPDGMPVIVEGIVDRVDIMERNGIRYVRVVDYKSGSKDFKLHDVLYGLNLQMLLYLFTIEENGKDNLSGSIPAGVLYMPVREQFVNAGREEGEAQVTAQRQKLWKMSGLLLDDEECLRGMESDIGGIYIPAKLDRKGRLDARSSVASRAEMGKLSVKVRELIVQMAQSLRNGQVSAFPIDSPDYDTCEYCDYRSVCGFESGDKVRTVEKISRKDFFLRLEQEHSGNQ